MRLALCLSGQPRVIKDGFKSINDSFINPVLHRAGLHKQWDADVFVHTWNDWKYVNRRGGELYSPSDIGTIHNLYHPKTMHIDEQMFHKDKFEWTKHPCNDVPRYFNAISMFYSIAECYKLCKQYELDQNIKYDIIVRCRFDVEIKDSQPVIMQIINIGASQENCIYGWQQCDEFFNDQIFWGRPSAMDIVCRTYDSLESIIEKKLWRTGEFLMMKVAENNNIKLSNCGGITWRLLRP